MKTALLHTSGSMPAMIESHCVQNTNKMPPERFNKVVIWACYEFSPRKFLMFPEIRNVGNVCKEPEIKVLSM